VCRTQVWAITLAFPTLLTTWRPVTLRDQSRGPIRMDRLAPKVCNLATRVRVGILNTRSSMVNSTTQPTPLTIRPMCPPYSTGEATERGYNQSTGGSGGSQPTASMPQGPPGQDPYNRYQPPGYAVNRAGYPPPTAPSSGPPGTPQQPGYPPQDNYYRQDQMPQSVSYPSSQLARQLVAPHSHAKSPYQQQVYASQQAGSSPSSPAGQMYPGGPQSKSMPPPAPQPRRHPDFAKEQQAYPPGPYTQHRPAIYGWSNNSQFRGQFPPQGPGAVPQAPQQWAQGPPRPAGAQPSNNQWDQHRYPPAGQPPYQPPSQVCSNMSFGPWRTQHMLEEELLRSMQY
ncbi:unnamed protein product, partial [Timema podura]|nr:unnamed protein product [Timema podura]